MSKPNELIEAVLGGKSASEVLEVEVTKAADGERTVITDKSSGAARQAVEKHMKALAAELEKLGVKFTARVGENYASMDWK